MFGVPVVDQTDPEGLVDFEPVVGVDIVGASHEVVKNSTQCGVIFLDKGFFRDDESIFFLNKKKSEPFR